MWVLMDRERCVEAIFGTSLDLVDSDLGTIEAYPDVSVYAYMVSNLQQILEDSIMRGVRLISVFFFVTLVCAVRLEANVAVVSNLANETSLDCPPFVVSSSRLIGGRFQTGSLVGGYKLADISISLTSVDADSTSQILGGLTVQIWNSTLDGTPDVVLDNLVLAEGKMSKLDSLQPGLVTFDSVGLILMPSTKYWVMAYVGESDTSKVSIQRTSDKSEVAHYPDWSIADFSYVFFDGKARLDSVCVPKFSVGIGIPEPSSGILFFLSLAFLVAVKRPRRLMGFS